MGRETSSTGGGIANSKGKVVYWQDEWERYHYLN